MNPIPYFVCFAAGMAVNALYNQRQKVAEKKAYNKGYKQAQKEEAIRVETYNQQIKLDRVYELPGQIEPEQKRPACVIDESFMECLQENGRAVIKFGGAINE